MRILIAATLIVALAGCGQNSETTEGSPLRPGHVRYTGVGIYSAGRLWAQIRRPDDVAKGAAQPAVDAAAAKLADDSTIIVVVDSATGEIRQCGDVSGFCTTMNPWTKLALGAPVVLIKHAADLDTDAARERASSPR